MMPKRAVVLGPAAVTQFKALSASERSRLKKIIHASLGDDDASVENTNRFRLRRPALISEFEFRDGDLRVFYRIEEDRVMIDAIGQKRGNQLFIGRRKVTL